ncbi:MAG: holo-ACP synthase [Chloroflexota bacterium]
MKLTNGIDLVEVPRLERAIARHGDRFLKRIFTRRELSLVGGKSTSLAARFAAKEAVAKALCTGIGDVAWVEIEILHGPNKEPLLILHGSAKKLAEEKGLHTWSLSLSHTAELAIAMVTALGE